jgi:large subunit ribosomal protein L35
MKTHSGSKARFWVTGSGKFMRRKLGVNNMRRKKRGETLRQMSGKMPVSPHVVKRLRRLMPYA